MHLEAVGKMGGDIGIFLVWSEEINQSPSPCISETRVAEVARKKAPRAPMKRSLFSIIFSKEPLFFNIQPIHLDL